jgi:Xaa-Pro aminopeptidase
MVNSELSLRWAKIQQMLAAQDVDACLISTNVNLYYTAGAVLGGVVYIPREGTPWFFVRRPAGMQGETLRYMRKVEQIPDLLAENNIPLPKTLMLEAGEVPYSDCLRFKSALKAERIVDGTTHLRIVRSIKTDYEIDQLREGARLQTAAYSEFTSLYRAGMTDHELTIEMERVMRQYGSLGMFRVFGVTLEAAQASVLAGDNAAAASPYDFALGGAGIHASLPIGHSGVKLEEGMSVHVDFGGNFNGYVSDMTRTYSIGKLSQKAYDAHLASLEIQNELAHQAKAGAVCEDMYKLSLKMVEKYGLSDCFMGVEQQAKFVGHGVGLVVNELPVLCDRNKTILAPNMTIALEPKFVIKGVGAVGTENTYVVTESGLEKITHAPEEIIDLVQ